MRTTLKTRTAAIAAAAGLVAGGLTLPGAAPAEAGSCKGKNSITSSVAKDPYSGIQQVTIDGYVNSCTVEKMIADWENVTEDPSHDLIALVPIAGPADVVGNALEKINLKKFKKAAANGTGVEFHRSGPFVNAKAQ